MIPPHAITLWVEDNILHLELPSAIGTPTPHRLKLPLNVWGLTQAIDLLKARHSTSRIGEKGDPTQAQVDKEMRRLAAGIDPSRITRPNLPLTPERRGLLGDILRKVGIS